MPLPTDLHLWHLVRKRVTPFGVPSRGGGHWAASTAPPPVLDLHNLTLQEAHAAVASFLYASHTAGRRDVTVITGKSGQIAREFPIWANLNPLVRRCDPLNGGGAFTVKFKKPKAS